MPVEIIASWVLVCCNRWRMASRWKRVRAVGCVGRRWATVVAVSMLWSWLVLPPAHHAEECPLLAEGKHEWVVRCPPHRVLASSTTMSLGESWFLGSRLGENSTDPGSLQNAATRLLMASTTKMTRTMNKKTTFMNTARPRPRSTD
jgi:hypothetical protein